MGRIIGLDIGDRRIGVALADELLITANGLDVIERVGIRKDCDRIIDIVERYGCDTVVIGLNKMLDGSDSPQTEKVYEFKVMLENKLRSTGHPNVKLEYYDERFTTKIAERVLIEGDVRRENRKKVIDKQAAILILQGYLDSHANGRK